MNQQSLARDIRHRARIGSQHHAGLVVPAQTGERLSFHNVYEFAMWSPLPHHRDAAIELRDEIARLEGMHIVERLHYMARLQRRREQLAALPHELAWRDRVVNLVPTIGKNDNLNRWFTSSSFTSAQFMFLVDSGATYNAADTMASHAGWTEDTSYSQSTRVTAAFSSAGSGAIALSSSLTFSINATVTLGGSGLCTVSTKGGSTGNLLSAGNFSGGNQPAVNGNTLSASLTMTLT